MPNLPAFAEQVPAVRTLAERGDGTLTAFEAVGQSKSDNAALTEAFTAARIDEWNEFVADCGKFDTEIDREFAKEKFTFGELEEEEQSLERCQRRLKTEQ